MQNNPKGGIKLDLSTCKAKINEYNKQIKQYAKYIKELQTILYNITGGLDDEIDAVNRKVDDLQEDLYNSVKYNSTFKVRVDEFDSKKEPRVRAIPDYNSAISSIDEEIRRISNLQQSASDSVDYYTREYNKEKQRIEAEKARKKAEEARKKAEEERKKAEQKNKK